MGMEGWWMSSIDIVVQLVNKLYTPDEKPDEK